MTKHKQKPGPSIAIRSEISLKDAPVQVQPGDQVYVRPTKFGPQVTRIVRNGEQLWPALKPD